MACDHAGAVPVESIVTGETLAALCPGCDTQLPAELLGCPHRDVINVSALDQPPGLYLCQQCGTTGHYRAVDGSPYRTVGTSQYWGLIGYWTDAPDAVLPQEGQGAAGSATRVRHQMGPSTRPATAPDDNPGIGDEHHHNNRPRLADHRKRRPSDLDRRAAHHHPKRPDVSHRGPPSAYRPEETPTWQTKQVTETTP